MYLPFWSSELQVEISSWFPWGKDYQPVSVNRFHSSTLRSIAASCLDLDSEFLFAASPLMGCVGNLSREKFFRYGSDNILHLGFLMIFGFSEKIENALTFSLATLKSAKGLNIGITFCTFLRGGVFEGKMKVIAIASDEPFYDCSGYLEGLDGVLGEIKKFYRTPNISYYAEKFGYDRFLMDWENINPYDLRINQIMSELQDNGAREIVGGSPKIDFPSFFGLAIATVEK
ncbi:MAG: hypothetical protein SPL10_07330 [Synergistales bacterium]|nr:hypothetical protein [Synergistales bacterium]MDY6401218.1 hypothetical protein [Synergistales bacterium]MDY6404442.1 hypothetical protein [Synergistales bacterium]MDY6410199.1 hypothetical protein [Synergistales bacterium]MDY6414951.1 hypothetical protein [Synergistales bacterium]